MSNIEELIATKLSNKDGDDMILQVAKALETLSIEDRKILAYYAELRSFRLMADALGASATTWRREIVRIRQEIIKQL
jgi:DNA-directed RNA polymerase specialized sigma24 family protein